jgi:hypothetical protein
MLTSAGLVVQESGAGTWRLPGVTFGAHATVGVVVFALAAASRPLLTAAVK